MQDRDRSINIKLIYGLLERDKDISIYQYMDREIDRYKFCFISERERQNERLINMYIHREREINM